VQYKPLGAASVLRRHLWIYGVGGVIIPFPGIKLVDMMLHALGWV
ncbi:MAG: Potassium-transporting ATPase chain, partial [candidate division NC10 bacterium]|nr:Potassium-transporting ATPase chain [candidate division NC10 bacterium]